jgi:hypothetical protein
LVVETRFLADSVIAAASFLALIVASFLNAAYLAFRADALILAAASATFLQLVPLSSLHLLIS